MGKNNGFTYIEMMIVMLVIGILAFTGISSYTEFNARKQTEARAKKIVEYLDVARQKTAAGDKPSSCGSYTGSYAVTLVGNLMSLTPGGCVTLATHSFLDFTFPEGDFTVTYQPLGGGMTGDRCIIIQHPKAPICEKITLESSGIVKDELLPEASCVCP